MKKWSQDSDFRIVENETIAEAIVRAYLYHELGKDVSSESGIGVYIVWQCYILGNRKYLIATDDPLDNLYFEVTYSELHDEWYLDVYDKRQNFSITIDTNLDFCYECEKNCVCAHKDECHLRQQKFMNSSEGEKLNEIQSHTNRPFAVELICSEFEPKKLM